MLIADAAAGGGVSPVEWIYIIGAVLMIVVSSMAIRSGFNRFIGQRQTEAVEKANLSKAIIDGAEATRENTAALTKMGQDFHDFATETRATLNGHAERLRHLEVRQPGS
jgi:nitrogen fixation/metabolism regulation signal transduction histidine kinase